MKSNKQQKISNNFIFVIGSIGVGKSTFIDCLLDRIKELHPIHIKEFIDYDPEGETKLNMNLKGEMSSFDFQKYIVDCYFNQFRNYHHKTLVVERHPQESLLFASQFLTKQEYDKLDIYIKNLCQIYGVPLLCECNATTIENVEIDETVNAVKELINSFDDLVINLIIDEREQVDRIRLRNRESDQKYLTDAGLRYLRKINGMYTQLRAAKFGFYKQENETNVFVFKGI